MDTTDDSAALDAAEVAVELSEHGTSDSELTGRKLRAAADRARAALTRAASRARRGGRQGGRHSDGHGTNPVSRSFTSGMNWLSAQVVAMGPRLRIRDQATLRAQFPGQSEDEIAQRLIERAARAAAAVGGTTGAWAALPSLPAFPAEIAVDTLAVVGIEVKLVAELHEVYGMAATGTATERARAYIGSWATRRGIYATDVGLLAIPGSPIAKQLTRRLAARVRRSTFALAPLFTGAVAGALLNRSETTRLGRLVKDDIKQQRVLVTATVIGQERSTESRGSHRLWPRR
jgi:hypothetical protein